MITRDLIDNLTDETFVVITYYNNGNSVRLEGQCIGKPITAKNCKAMWKKEILNSEIISVSTTITFGKSAIEIVTDYRI